MTIKRIQVKETEGYYGDFGGSLVSIIAHLQGKLDAGWVGIETDCEPYEDYTSFYLYKHREENDKEYEQRVKLLERVKAVEEKNKRKSKERKLNQLKKDLASLSAADKKQLGL